MNNLKCSSLLMTMVATFMATQFLSLRLYNSGRVLEDPLFIMGNPFPSFSYNMFYLNALIRCGSYEQFYSQTLLVGQCTHDTIGS
jgi:hypothetical protein